MLTKHGPIEIPGGGDGDGGETGGPGGDDCGVYGGGGDGSGNDDVCS